MMLGSAQHVHERAYLALFILGLAMVAQPSRGESDQWIVDSGPSRVEFRVSHLVLSTVHGRFDKIEGQATTVDDGFSNALIDVRIPVANVSTGLADRDRGLLGEDLLAAGDFPFMEFHSRALLPKGDRKFTLGGDLTIRGVTKDTDFDVEFLGLTETSLGTLRADFEATTRINRFDFGVRWNELFQGTFLVGEWIDIDLKIALVRH